MSKKKEMSDTSRRSLLAVVMLVLLAGSVGAAWWVSSSRHYDPQAAKDILAEIREKRLPAFWSDKPVENWYILRTANKTVLGWRLTRRVPIPGGYWGKTIEQVGTSTSRQIVTTEESWKINDTATDGAYETQQRVSGMVSVGGRGMRLSRLSPKTTYSLKDETIRVVRSDGRHAIDANSDTPANYIPAGILPLVMYRTAIEGHKTIYTTLIPESAIENRDVVFHVLRVTPEGGRVVRAIWAESETTFAFDESGRLVKETDLQTQVSAEISTPSAVIRAFPEARQYRRADMSRPAPTTGLAPATTEPTTDASGTQPATEPAPNEDEPEGF